MARRLRPVALLLAVAAVSALALPGGSGPAGASVGSASGAAAPGATGATGAVGQAGPGLRYLDQVFSSVQATPNLTYGSAINDRNQTEALKLDLYRPAGDTATDRPAVVMVHGGGFVGGSKESFRGRAEDLALRGYVVVSIDYRLATVPIGRTPGQPPSAAYLKAVTDAKHDAQAAVRWLRANAGTYGIDPDRIGITGGSAGAVTSLTVAWGSDEPGNSGNPGYSSEVLAAVADSGAAGDILQDPSDPPALMLNGTADTTVLISEATETCDAAVAVGIWCTLVPFVGVPHTVGNRQPTLSRSLTATSFYEHLVTGGSTPPIPDAVSFVQRQYQDLLLRDADPAGLDFWSRRVARGTTSPEGFVDELAQSPELQRSIGAVTRSFLGYLGRPPDPSGLAYWVGKIRGGTSSAKVDASLAASPEFQRRQAGLTDGEFVDALYADLLARPADPGGRAYWLRKLASGTSRASVVASYVTQPESIRATAPDVAVSIGTVGLLGRAPTTAERTEWVAAMRGGAPATDWYAFVLASAEYEARVTP